MKTFEMYCKLCNTKISVHADGSAMCSCMSREVGDGKKLPASWGGEGHKEFRKHMKYIRDNN